MKSKDELISEVAEIFRTMGHNGMHYQFESWRKLDVPLAQLKSLFIMHVRGSISVRDLANDLGVTPGNVTSIIDRMVGQGLVRRTENPDDRRIVLLQLTEKGRETFTNIHETSHLHMKRLLEMMTTEELDALALGGRAFLKVMEIDYKEMPLRKNIKDEHYDMSSAIPEHSIHHRKIESA
jgi:MarR family transcriptional regulator, organic hydroperoxide resistance regulator